MQKADATAFLTAQVNDHTAALLADKAHGFMQLGPAIAAP